MTLDILKIRNLRNIRAAELQLSSSQNLLVGQNGAGKTTILEAIYMLGRGRSFRGERAGPLISRGEEVTEIFGQYAREGGGARKVGIRKGKKELEIRVDGQGLRRLSELARLQPVLVITPRSHEIVERGPEYRRRFLDWGVFHVEQGFHDQFLRFRRALKQRNAALRQGQREVSAWSEEVIASGLSIERARLNFVEALQPYFTKAIHNFLPTKELRLSYRPSANTAEEYREKLRKHRDDEARRGYTIVGPHRANMHIKLEGQDISSVASRGEQKLVVAALFMAQARLVSEIGASTPILLVDDLPAELDSRNRAILENELSGLGIQIVITSSDNHKVSPASFDRTFHVEQGQVTPVDR